MAIFSLFFAFSLFPMDAPDWLMSKDVIHLGMSLSNDLQTIGRFGQTSHENNQWYRRNVGCKNPHDNDCKSPMCCSLGDSFDKCTQSLVFYAKEYKKNPSDHSGDMFKHLWRHHDQNRDLGVRIVLEKTNPIWDDYIEIYAGNYAAKEMAAVSGETSYAKKMKEALSKANSSRLKRFLLDKNFLAVTTMLLANNLLFDPQWSGHKYNRDKDKYQFGSNKKDTILDCACLYKNGEILDSIVKASKISCFGLAVKSIINYHKMEMLERFVRKNFVEAKKLRFQIAGYALEERNVWNSAPIINDQQKIEMLEKIVELLFPNEIDARDDYEGTLLNIAVGEQNILAVDFLLKKGLSPNLVNKNGSTVLYDAHEYPTVVSCLLTHKADVNQRSYNGRIALVAAASYLRCNQKTKEVIKLLLQAGSDVNAVDDDNKSVLHYYVDLSVYHSMNHREIAELLSLFISYGAKVNVIDNDGKTPFDHAQEYNNIPAMELLHIHAQKEMRASASILSTIADPLIE